MKSIRKNFSRAFLCLTLIFATLIATAGNAHAQIGQPNEVWTSSDSSAPITIYDTNLTPVKTMGRSGKLNMWFAFTKGDNGPAEKMNVEVRNTTQNKTYYKTIHNPVSIDEWFWLNNIYVNQGDKIQVFFDICTEDGYAKPGYKRTAIVQYGYAFSN